MRVETRLRHLERDIGDRLEAHQSQRDLSEFRKWVHDPVGFMRDEVGFTPYPKPEEIAQALLDQSGPVTDWLAEAVKKAHDRLAQLLDHFKNLQDADKPALDDAA